MCAVDVAIAQGAAFQHAELVEQKIGVVAGAVEVPVLGGFLPVAKGGYSDAFGETTVLGTLCLTPSVRPTVFCVAMFPQRSPPLW